jgi:hypothetical protein
MSYGNLYKRLSKTTGEIPIGIYRTDKQLYRKQSISLDIEGLITTKLNKLGIDSTGYKTNNETINKNASYVLINPSSELALQNGDVIYLLKPGTTFSIAELSPKLKKENENSNLSNLNKNTKKLIFFTRKPPNS